MRPVFLVLLTCVAAMLAVGQILFRVGAQRAAPVVDASTAINLMLNPVIVVALIIYGFTTLLYVYVLQNVPLSAAYPFMALSFVVVPMLAILLLGETTTPRYFVGLALIIGGLIVSNL